MVGSERTNGGLQVSEGLVAQHFCVLAAFIEWYACWWEVWVLILTKRLVKKTALCFVELCEYPRAVDPL